MLRVCGWIQFALYTFISESKAERVQGYVHVCVCVFCGIKLGFSWKAKAWSCSILSKDLATPCAWSLCESKLEYDNVGVPCAGVTVAHDIYGDYTVGMVPDAFDRRTRWIAGEPEGPCFRVASLCCWRAIASHLFHMYLHFCFVIARKLLLRKVPLKWVNGHLGSFMADSFLSKYLVKWGRVRSAIVLVFVISSGGDWVYLLNSVICEDIPRSFGENTKRQGSILFDFVF